MLTVYLNVPWAAADRLCYLTMHREVAWGINLAKAPDLVISLLKSYP